MNINNESGEFMRINDFKGTLYDLLGYFAPGLISIIMVYITYLRIQNSQNIIYDIKFTFDKISGFEVFVLILLAYVMGHVVATISSILIERILMNKIDYFNKKINSEKIIGKDHYELLCKKYKTEFNLQYSDCNIRKVICYIQEKHNSIYETSMVFLSFYGMARNFALLFGVLFIVEIVLFILTTLGNIYIILINLLLFSIFLYEYFRFRKYFIDTILSGFIVSEKNIY